MVTTSNSFGVDVGVELEVKGEESKKSAIAKLATKFSTTSTHMTESTTCISSIVSDENKYSELYCYVDYNGKNNGRISWERNDLGLKQKHRWAEGSEMIVDITF